jgi:hypothetical protein
MEFFKDIEKEKNSLCLYLKADKLSNTYELSIKYF